MQLTFSITAATGTRTLAVAIDHFVIAGWAGRDAAAIEHHIEELAEIGVPRPSAVPLFYRVAANQMTQDDTVQVVGPDSSGEVEVLLPATDEARDSIQWPEASKRGVRFVRAYLPLLGR